MWCRTWNLRSFRVLMSSSLGREACTVPTCACTHASKHACMSGDMQAAYTSVRQRFVHMSNLWRTSHRLIEFENVQRPAGFHSTVHLNPGASHARSYNPICTWGPQSGCPACSHAHALHMLFTPHAIPLLCFKLQPRTGFMMLRPLRSGYTNANDSRVPRPRACGLTCSGWVTV